MNMAQKKSGTVIAGVTGWADELDGLTKDEAIQRFPKLAALTAGWDGPRAPNLEIRSTVAGFRRGGISHPVGPETYDFFHFKPEQIERMLCEPVLIVRLVEAKASADDEGNAPDNQE